MGRAAPQARAIDEGVRDRGAQDGGARDDAAFAATMDLLAAMHDHPDQAKRLPANARFPFEGPATVAWREAQQRYQRVCGCASGGIAALAAMGLAVAWSLTQADGVGLVALVARTLALAIAAAVLAGAAGKLTGIAVGTARFRRATVRAIAELGQTARPARFQ